MPDNTFSASSHLTLRNLHIGEEDEGEYEVGDPTTGTFVSLPPEGVKVITWLAEGKSLGEVTSLFEQTFQQPLDIDDFVNSLIECHLVLSVDGCDLHQERPAALMPNRGWYLFADIPTSYFIWLRSRPLIILYWGIWIVTTAFAITHPSLLPTSSDAVIYPRVFVNALLLAILGWCFTFFHELAHLCAAKSYGCVCSLSVSHRLHFLVAQTDMTAIRTCPRHQRYGPYLAGMTWNVSILLICLLLRLTPYFSSLFGAIGYIALLSTLFEFFFFLRTDLYYVLCNWLHLGNLMQDTQHWLLNLLASITGRTKPYDLSAIPHREIRFIRFYAIFYVIGVSFALGEFLFLILPLLIHFLTQAWSNILMGPKNLSFWDGISFYALLVCILAFCSFCCGKTLGV